MDGGPVVLNGDIPKALKMVMIFIDRVGFPVLAFLLMFYISYCSISKMTVAIQDNAMAIKEFRISTNDFQNQVTKDHDALAKAIAELQKYSYGYQDYKQGKRSTE